ncbi:MAG: hypothetical protein ACYCPQ_00055 [Elusimicrobiota bacterium]
MRLVERREIPGSTNLYLGDLDGTGKRLIEFSDAPGPGFRKSERWVMMIAAQIGCPVGCRMCDAGAVGYRGNLNAEEILWQARQIILANPDLKPSAHPGIEMHLSRMGEPSLNPETLAALRRLARETPWPRLTPCFSTVAPESPAIDPFFSELIEVKNIFPRGRFRLQFSIHSSDETHRRRIVPIRKWSLERIAAYGEKFVLPGDQKIYLNFVRSPSAPLDAETLRRLFNPDKFLARIAPASPTRSTRESDANFLWSRARATAAQDADRLRQNGFEVLYSADLKSSRKSSAGAHCGEIWSETMKKMRRLTTQQSNQP